MMVNQIIKLKAIQTNQYSALSLQKYKLQLAKNESPFKITYSLTGKNKRPYILRNFNTLLWQSDDKKIQNTQSFIVKEIKNMYHSVSSPKKIEEIYKNIDMSEYASPKRSKKARSMTKRLLPPAESVFLTEPVQYSDFHLPTIYNSRTKY